LLPMAGCATGPLTAQRVGINADSECRGRCSDYCAMCGADGPVLGRCGGYKARLANTRLSIASRSRCARTFARRVSLCRHELERIAEQQKSVMRNSASYRCVARLNKMYIWHLWPLKTPCCGGFEQSFHRSDIPREVATNPPRSDRFASCAVGR